MAQYDLELTDDLSVLDSKSIFYEDTYVTVAEMRAEGLPQSLSDAQIQASLKLWQTFIDRATRQWYKPIELELRIDGTDSDTLYFGVPIISVSEVMINNETTLLDTNKYRVYNANRYPADKQNPRIQLVDAWESHRDIYTASSHGGRSKFRKGQQNQYVKGIFGCVEADGTPPPMIKRALSKLVVEKLANPVVPGTVDLPPPVMYGVILEEWTDSHSRVYAPAGGAMQQRAPGLLGITNDWEIINILKLFKAPIGIATPNGPSYTP